MSNTRAVATCVALAMSACNTESSHVEEPSNVVDRPVQRSGRLAPPITGNTLLVSADGKTAIATDADRDLVHVVDLELDRASAIVLPEGSQPFRAAFDDHGRAHVTLRGTGEIASVDPARRELIATAPVCAAPRGVAFDPRSSALRVACAGGQLVTVDPQTREVTARVPVARDLRDVIVSGDRLLVSRFRTAEVYEIADDGTATLVAIPESLRVRNTVRKPNTAWRLLATPTDGWLMLHQLATTLPLPGSDPSIVVGPVVDGYGGSGPDPCSGSSNPSLTAALTGGKLSSIGGIPQVALAVDVAISPDGLDMVIASPSQHERDEPDVARGLLRASIADFAPGPGGECRDPMRLDAADDFVAVAFDHDGEVLALSRTSPKLYRFDGVRVARVIDLEGETVRDTGHEMFHLDAGGGIACASCHPEGGDDGIVWTFADVGARRTPALDIGIEGTEPFHWSGDLSDMSAIVTEVRGRRMGGAPHSAEHATALADWIFELPPPPPVRTLDDGAARAGEALFAELGCARCHSGPALTSNGWSDLGTGSLQVPPLHGVAMRPPYMHDGRASDLTSAVIDMLDATPEARRPTDDEVAAIVAYLETL